MRQDVPRCTKAHFVYPFLLCIFGAKKYKYIWVFGKT